MDIKERIRKLHALAERNSSTHEAAAAAAKAQALCFEYNLELEAVIASGAGQKAPYVKADYVMKATRNDAGWKRTLFGGICKANFCKTVYYPGTVKMGVVGQKHNFDVVCYLFEYLVQEIERLAVKSCIDEGIIDKRAKYMRDFCQGAMSSVYHRLQETLKQSAMANTESRALVVVKDKELDAAAFRYFGRTRSVGRSSAIGNGYSQGRSAGGNMPINAGIGNKGRQRLT